MIHNGYKNGVNNWRKSGNYDAQMPWHVIPVRLIYYRPRWKLLFLLITAMVLTIILIHSCSMINMRCPSCRSFVLFHKNTVNMDFDFRKYINMSWNRQEPNTPLATLFTTWNPSMQRPVVYENTMRTWSSMGPVINPVVFTNNSNVSYEANKYGWKNYSISSTACFGTPVLRTMFQEAIRNERSILYGYSNADILFNDGLIRTLEAITKNDEFEKGPILVVGKRIDVNISKLNEPKVRNTREVDKLAKHGAISWGFAGDYFFTNDLFPWEFIPDLVVGRPLVDNWLLWYARQVGAKIIDASGSVLAVHQLANGLKRIKFLCNKAEAWKRNLLPPLPIYQGLIECAHYETKLDSAGNVVIFKKLFQFELCKHSEAIFH